MPTVAQPESPTECGKGGDKEILEQGFGDPKGKAIARGVLEECLKEGEVGGAPGNSGPILPPVGYRKGAGLQLLFLFIPGTCLEEEGTTPTQEMKDFISEASTGVAGV